MNVEIKINHALKKFGENVIIPDLSLNILPGEFFTLLGPSGCGKTTTLRIIAGLEMPTAGRVFLDGQDITHLAPEKREVNTVFQNYALFPHMNVWKNIAYGLRMRGVSKAEIDRKVPQMLEMVQLEGYGKRLPSQLSGGQRQRVAIARSLILSPKLLLLDEPLGALDLQLRRQMQQELKRMQRQLGITFIYITHDQEEALTMSDRVALMRNGRFVQLDTPKGLYEQPRTAFAASFIGETNLINATASAVKEEEVLLDISGFEVPCACGEWITPGEQLLVSLRAERLHLSARAVNTPCRVMGELVESHYAGGERASLVRLPDGQALHVRSTTEGEQVPDKGSQVCIWWQQTTGVIVRDDREGNQ